MKKSNGFGITSLILGIVGLVLSCLIVGMVPACIGLMLGIIGLCQKDKPKGTSVAGTIISLIGLIISIMIIAIGSGSSEEDSIKEVENVAKTNVEEGSEKEENSEMEEAVRESEQEIDVLESPKESLIEAETEEDETVIECEKVEIVFKDLQWGNSFPEVDAKLSSWELWNLYGDSFQTCSVDEILLGDYKGIDFEYGGINLISNALYGEQEVAGYTTTGITLYFAFIPVNGYLTYDEKDTVLYGAQYKFEPINLKETNEDFVSKLSGIYGEPSKVTNDADMWENEYTYTYWYGANDTELVLRCINSEKDTTGFYNDEIYITYAWRGGDELLKDASDAIKKENSDKENEARENGDSSGL